MLSLLIMPTSVVSPSRTTSEMEPSYGEMACLTPTAGDEDLDVHEFNVVPIRFEAVMIGGVQGCQQAIGRTRYRSHCNLPP